MNKQEAIDFTSWRDSFLMPLQVLRLHALRLDDAPLKFNPFRMIVSMLIIGTIVLSGVMAVFIVIVVGVNALFLPMFSFPLWLIILLMSGCVEFVCATGIYYTVIRPNEM